MKVNKEFAPVTLTIETQEEWKYLHNILVRALDNGFNRCILPDDTHQRCLHLIKELGMK